MSRISPKTSSVGKLLSIELIFPDEKIVYDCLQAIFVNFTIGVNVKVLQLRDAISRKKNIGNLSRFFCHRREVHLAIRNKNMKS